MAGPSGFENFFGHQNIMVTQYEARAMIFFLHPAQLDYLDFTMSRTVLSVY